MIAGHISDRRATVSESERAGSANRIAQRMQERTVNVQLDLDERDLDLMAELLAEHHFESRSAVVRSAIGLLRAEIDNNGSVFIQSGDHSRT